MLRQQQAHKALPMLPFHTKPMTNVYRIVTDVNHYQYFFAEHEEQEVKLLTDCSPRAVSWQPPLVYVYKPRHKIGDFYSFHACSLITSPRATIALATFLEMAGELLPLPYNGQEYTLLNITECINCLDHERTKWLKDETGANMLPQEYMFHRNRFATSRLFKIPETCGGEILVVDRDPGLEEEFKSAVELAGLQGLDFKELWSDESA